MQRIDQDITGAVYRRRPDCEVDEIGEVADPQDCRDRTLYSWAASPQARRAPSRSGSPSQPGVTISAALAS